jgi:amidophosphoribosyltransferase
MGEVHEKCAVVGAFGPNAGILASEALRVLDHRGPDSTGIGGITNFGEMHAFREPGMAAEVLTPERIKRIGNIGMVATVGHGRYPTSGIGKVYHPIAAGEGNKQILYAENANGSFLPPLEADLSRRGIDTTHMNDTEMNTWAISDRYTHGASLVEAIADAYPHFVGARSSVVIGRGLDGEPMMAAFRDPFGVKPLVWGQTKEREYVVASETIGLEAAGARYIAEVEPGSLMTFTAEGIRRYELAKATPKFDAFEIIYFSNKESLFKGMRIGDIRAGLGAMLAAEYGDRFQGTITAGVPNSANTYAEGYSEASGLEYRKGAILKRDSQRSFLQPSEALRRELRNRKYLLDGSLFYGEDMDVLDDSLVRNNTAPHITRTLLEEGAKSVNILIGSPPIRFPNFYGINTPDQKDLIAANMSLGEMMRTRIKCQNLGFLSLRGMLDVFYALTGETEDRFEISCFTGDYPIPVGKRDIIIPKFDDIVA